MLLTLGSARRALVLYTLTGAGLLSLVLAGAQGQAFNPYREAQQRAEKALAQNQMPQARAWILEALELAPSSPSHALTPTDKQLVARFKDMNGQDKQSVVQALACAKPVARKASLKSLLPYAPAAASPSLKPITQLVLPDWESINHTELNEARSLLRQERYPEALALYKGLLQRYPNWGSPEAKTVQTQPQTLENLAGTAAGLAYRIASGSPSPARSSAPVSGLDWGVIGSKLPGPDPTTPALQLDKLLLELAHSPTGTVSGPAKQQLLKLGETPTDDLTAGLALWTVGDTARANERLDAVDGQNTAAYLQVVDRLMLAQVYQQAQVMAQRGLELNDGDGTAQEGLQHWTKRLAARRSQANTHVQLGNTLFASKQYKAALQAYQDAQACAPDWDTPYLRLGETSERLGQDKQAFEAYEKAIRLTPALMDSRLFVKKYHRLERKAQHAS